MDVKNELEGKFALHRTFLDYYGVFKILEIRVWLKTEWLVDSKVKVSIRGEKTCWMNADEFIISDSVEELEMMKDRLIEDKLFNALTYQVDVKCQN